VIDGKRGYYVAEEYEGQIIGTFLPSGEYYAQRNSQTLVVFLSLAIIFGLLLYMIMKGKAVRFLLFPLHQLFS